MALLLPTARVIVLVLTVLSSKASENPSSKIILVGMPVYFALVESQVYISRLVPSTVGPVVSAVPEDSKLRVKKVLVSWPGGPIIIPEEPWAPPKISSRYFLASKSLAGSIVAMVLVLVSREIETAIALPVLPSALTSYNFM